MLVQSNTYLIKFYFSITKREQDKRFADIKSDSLKHWKMTPVDEKAQALWDDTTPLKEQCVRRDEYRDCSMDSTECQQ